MAERDQAPTSRKAARSLPLTHRQSKATQRPQQPRRKAKSTQKTQTSQNTLRARKAPQPVSAPRRRPSPRPAPAVQLVKDVHDMQESAPAVALPERPAMQARQGRKKDRKPDRTLRPAGVIRAEAPTTNAETLAELASASLTAPATAAPVSAPSETPTEAEASEDAPTPRKLPTLAVMAALAPRAEPVSGPLDEPTSAASSVESNDDAHATPVAPVAPAALATSATDATLGGASMPDAPDTPDAPAESPAPQDITVAENQAAPASDDGEAPARRDHAMWWVRAARRRAAPETRPLVDQPAPTDDDVGDGVSDETDAERAALTERTAPTPRETARLASSDEALDNLPGDQSDPSEPGALGRWRAGQRASAAHEAHGDASDELFLQRRRAAARHRMIAARSPRAVVLSWAAGGHATLASVAAVVAVIAALNSDAGAVAMTVFGWALTLAVIAGVSAAAGYLCAQIGRPRLATLALGLGQLCALGWALALLGPRAALLALAPASVALALRGSGRLGAVATALLWMSLFIVAEALTLSGALTPTLPLAGLAAALVDVALPLVGLWLVVSVLISLYSSRMQVAARGRAIEHVALRAEDQLALLRAQLEDDADELRHALAEALRGEEPEHVEAHGALSVVASALNDLADRLVDLRYDRAERKRLESAIRRLTRVMERAWLGLSWSWPDATGTLLDDLLALLRTPPPADTPDQLDETSPTGRVVAPHLFRGWQPSEPDAAPSAPSQPSAPSLPSLWPSDPGAGLADPLDLELPPSPRWRGPDSVYDTTPRPDGSDH